MATITVDYERMPGYPQERMSFAKYAAVDKVICDWDDRVQLARELIGWVGNIKTKPHLYTDNTYGDLYAGEIEIEPIMSMDGAGSYEKATLTIEYSTVEWEYHDADEVYVEENIEPASEFVTISTDGLYWSISKGNPLPKDSAPSKIERYVEWVYRIYQIKSLPEWVWSYPGTINSKAVTSRKLDITFDAGTLLCGNPEATRQATTNGHESWELTVRFTYNSAGWNYYMKTNADGDVTYSRIYDGASNTKKFYAENDFRNIVI